MDKTAKEYIFLNYFNPKRDSGLNLKCPMCSGELKILAAIGRKPKFVCKQCEFVLDVSEVEKKLAETQGSLT